MTELTMTEARAVSAGATYAYCPVCSYRIKIPAWIVLFKGKKGAVAYEEMWLSAKHAWGNNRQSVHK